jgi:hypothetical protein
MEAEPKARRDEGIPPRPEAMPPHISSEYLDGEKQNAL